MSNLLTREQFTKKYLSAAKRAAAGTGIFPETILAIAIVESQGKGPDGNYYPANNASAKYANNLFGIKAYPDWKGPTVLLSTPGDSSKKSRFVKYSSPGASFSGFVRFLRENERYTRGGVFTAPNFQEQIIRIAAAGYSERPETWKGLIFAVDRSIEKFINQTTSAVNSLAPWFIIAGLFYFSLNKVEND